MKPYAENEPCPKCGCAEVSVMHYDERAARGTRTLWGGWREKWPAEPEHMSVSCKRCHARWKRAPRDAEADQSLTQRERAEQGMRPLDPLTVQRY
jgi:hypothetical protein